MRSVLLGSFFVCVACFLLIFTQHSAGQRSRDLLDIPPAYPPPNTPAASQVQSGRTPSGTTPSLPFGRIPATLPSNAGSATTNTTPNTAAERPFNFTLPSGSGLESFFPRIVSDETLRTAAPITTPVTPAAAVPVHVPLAPRILAIIEEKTLDENEAQELFVQRQRAEQTSDPVKREALLAQVEQVETNYRNRLARRKSDEIGADLFYHPQLREQFLRSGWCQLFDGHTSTGWTIQTQGHYGGENFGYRGGNFTFGNHEIVSDPYKPGLIYTDIPFGDVTLRFDFWAEKDSKVYLLMKSPAAPTDLNSDCYTFVLNSPLSNQPRGLLLGRHGHSFAELRMMRETWDSAPQEGAWHSIRVHFDGNEISFQIDGRRTLNYYDDNPIASGHIGFLVLNGTAKFQNILWQPNNPEAIFDTEIATEMPWRIFDGAEFAGNDGEFRLARGSVESRKRFDNYVLQMEYFQGTFSGIASLFVRSLPNKENTGYEISLQNFPRRKDRETMTGVDAGSFRDAKDARYVRARDLEWTYLTVVVMDRQIQTWVNGVPVCGIKDNRSLQSARGPWLEAGTIRLSVPEENTAFRFRHLNVSPVHQ